VGVQQPSAVATPQTGSVAARVSVWEELRERLSLGTYVPVLRTDLTLVRLTTRRGCPYTMLADRPRIYLRLTEEDDFLVRRMDGSRTVSELVVDFFHAYGRFGFEQVAELVAELRRSGLLRDPPGDLYADLQQTLKPPPQRRSRWGPEGSVLVFRLPLRGIDGLVSWVHDRVGGLLFARPTLLLSAAVTLVGLTAFIGQLRGGRDPFAPVQNSHVIGLLALVLAYYAVVMVHESSHALTCKHWGRRVDEGGFMLYYLVPAFYVNVTDVWLEPWSRRIAVFWAGPYSGFVLAGAGSLAVWALPGGWVVTAILFKLAFAAYVNNLFNLLPLLRLDGYFILEDWLEIPQLRERALAFVRGPMWEQLLERRWFTRGEFFYAVFGGLSAVYSFLSIFLAVFYWRRRLGPIVRPLWLTPGLITKTAAGVLIALVGIPLSIRFGRRFLEYQRALRRAPAQAKKALVRIRLRDRMQLLQGLRFLQSFPPASLERLARAAKVKEAPTGTVVVRQGDRGEEFFLIAGGSAEVLVRQGGEDRPVTSLGAGDFFGERALLGAGIRQATVRAAARLRLLTFTSRTFWQELAAPVAWERQLRASLEERARLEALPLFADATPRQLDLLAVKLRTERFAAGDIIVRQGDPGDAFYIVREGSVEVLSLKGAGRACRLRVLGAGDFFGEIALLRDVPRTATVRGKEAGSVWRLQRQDFRELLGRYLELEDSLGGVAESRVPRGHAVTAGAA